MLDVFLRAVINPLDYFGVANITELTFLKKENEAENIFTFTFTANKLPKWKAGQHAIFSFPNEKMIGGNWRVFSIASFPDEKVIKIGTVISEQPSVFKKKLISLIQGDKIRMFGPYGEMYLKPKMEQIVAVAGGIGITPFRSIVGDIALHKTEINLDLIYSAENYTYKNEFEEWQQENNLVKINYTNEPEETIEILQEKVKRFGNDAYYFISGSPKMIEEMRRELRSRLIKPSHIINDPFKGY